MIAEVKPPHPMAPSLNSKPNNFLGRPMFCEDVIKSPELLTAIKIYANLF